PVDRLPAPGPPAREGCRRGQPRRHDGALHGARPGRGRAAGRDAADLQPPPRGHADHVARAAARAARDAAALSPCCASSAWPCAPRHADCLRVTGPVTRNMAEALRRTWHATPDPKIVIAAGDCAGDGGLFRGSYAVVGGVREIVPVDALIPGCPPSPAALLAGLLDALGRPRCWPR